MKYKDENNILLQNILDKAIIDHWKDSNKPQRKGLTHGLELIITPECNQKCEYCYFVKYNKLYPKEIVNHTKILENMNILFDWLLETKHACLPELDLFSGEIWHTSFGWQVLDLILKYLHKGLKIKCIIIPTNASFVLNDTAAKKLLEYRRLFDEAGCSLHYSLSVDGPYVDNITRPLVRDKNLNIKNKDYYRKVLEFVKDTRLCFHPILSSKAAKNWVKNIKWWFDICNKYQIFYPERVGILEARNNDWTQETLKEYFKVLDAQIDYFLNDECSGDIKNLTKKIFIPGYQGIQGGLNISLLNSGDGLGCTAPRLLAVRLGDLAICPCHRTAYPELLYGKFKVDNNKIVGIEANNVYMAIKTLTSNLNKAYLKCDTCNFKTVCMKQCLGACKEYENDPFMPNDNVCLLLKAKYYYLVSKYVEMGIYDTLDEMVKTDPSVTASDVAKFKKTRDLILSQKEEFKWIK